MKHEYDAPPSCHGNDIEIEPLRQRNLYLETAGDTRQHNFQPTFTNGNNNSNSNTSRSSRTTGSYDVVERDDYSESFLPPLQIPKARAPSIIASISSRSNCEPIIRTASGRERLRHPIPDLQTLQGAYTGNIQLLERTAERLSMTSSIDDAIRELHAEQKRNDSRRSSLLSSPDMAVVTRQFSNGSIVDTNNLARSGGYSPAAFMMSPKGSFSTGNGRGRSTSKSSSRYRSRPEPELEGRPLDSFVNLPMPEPEPEPEPTLPLLSSASIAEQDETTNTLTRPFDHLGIYTQMAYTEPVAENELATPASATAPMDFEDFDGVHSAPQRMADDEPEQLQRRTLSGDQSVAGSDGNRTASMGNRLSMARPQSYADPNTGHQMVYYPAPVPMMLNLPQKLSKMPSSMARNKRRTQALAGIPQGARQSAIWLPDVLETEDEPDVPEHDEAQQLEYVPQHQRASMGGRRLTQDIHHLPPQLRANAFFELQGPNQTVELKEQSAVATLDSILDASAHAPVTAFTDHAFAGHLGAEVYGRPNLRNSKSSSQLLQPDLTPKKRASSFNLLRGRRASSSNLLETDSEKQRANTIADIRDGKILRDENDENGEGVSPIPESEGVYEENEEEQENEFYHGAPTTLLAELQLRKQQAKMRTRPLASAYPNGSRSTLLQLDAVAQVEQKSRKQKRIHLAWEEQDEVVEDDIDDDEEVPLALLYAKKSQLQDLSRPMGLMERREMEDNEPLSRRRDRLQGRPPTMMTRASTMIDMTANMPEEEGETLAQRVRRLKEAEQSSPLPSARPVSGDFASEMMSQFGGDLADPKGKGKAKEFAPSPEPEEEETLGQRRKRLQAEREARALEVGDGEAQERPKLQSKRSMADILSAHPAAGASNRTPSYGKQLPSSNGLLGLHERETMQRASTMMNLGQSSGRQANAGGFKSGLYNDGQGGIVPSQPHMQRQSSYNLFASPTAAFQQQGSQQGFYGNQMMPFGNPYAMNGMQMNGMNMGYMQPNPMAAMNMMQMGIEPLNKGQIDTVERWRRSVMQ